jgi:hypothetical protein
MTFKQAQNVKKTGSEQGKLFNDSLGGQTSVLEIQVNAALTGHDLGLYEPVETFSGGYEDRCRYCNKNAGLGILVSRTHYSPAAAQERVKPEIEYIENDLRVTLFSMRFQSCF